MMQDQKLTIEQSAALLHAIFPAYPVLLPCNPMPSREAWELLWLRTEWTHEDF